MSIELNQSNHFVALFFTEGLKLDLDYDHVALGEIQLALYTFLDTVRPHGNTFYKKKIEKTDLETCNIFS